MAVMGSGCRTARRIIEMICQLHVGGFASSIGECDPSAIDELFAPRVEAGHYPLPTISASLVGFAGVASVPPTTRSAGFAAMPLPRRAGLRALVAAVAGSSPTTRSAGSGATLPITRRVRTRRAVAPSM
jgi:hypothetical protein